MTFEICQLFIGIAVVSLSVNYAIWSKVRVTFLREDLFRVRDELWDKMRELDSLDHPAHVVHRDFLNSCIRVAHLISVPTILHFLIVNGPALNKMAKESDSEQKLFPVGTPSGVRKAVQLARRESVGILYNYSVKHRASGWFLTALIASTSAGHKMLDSWVSLGGARRLDRAEKAGAAM